jgi:hypothetical protein
MAPEQGSAPGAPRGEMESPSFSSFLLPVLTAIGTGIGVLGFVMFFGGFILWSRFKGTGLPANEAVAKVPRSELVATGASFLVPGVLAALGVVAVAVAVWDACIGRPRRHARESAEARCEEATERLADLEEERQQLEQRKGEASGAEAAEIAKRLAELGRIELPAQRQAQREAADDTKSEPLEFPERLLQILIGIVPLAAAAAYLIYKGRNDLSFEYFAYLAVAAILMGAIAIVVVSMTRHFAWYALCVFLGVGVMIAASNYVRTQAHPKVSPVAALNGPSPVVGYFVAETGDAVYVGRPQVEPDSTGFDRERATLIRIPKKSVVSLTVGPLMDADQAYRRSLELATALCRRAEATAKVASKEPKKGEAPPPAAPTICSKRETKLLAYRDAKAP